MHETRTTAEGYNQGREPKNSMHNSTGSAIEYVATYSSGNSHRFRPPFFTFEVALDSSLEALSIDSPFGGCSGLERNLEATVFLPCGCAFRTPSCGFCGWP
ncbi:hypothetical protein F511_21764 [Dorcoceras hygrometricum]|uniref:Uncharacterized protein n=1 Tax=Dorcoceras hygrometricum TaxID=472368 RepID=A0A2Z7AG05_9LAMI|nr:hypothetical protein F511_21764 [Dorcoceras hygrometricum]